MAILSSGGRYKRTNHPTLTAKEAGLKNEARVRVLGAPYDYQRLKKLNAQQALENPDWRTRPSDGNSSTVEDEEQSNIRGLIAVGRQWIGMDASPAAPSDVENKQEVDLQQTIDPPQDGAENRGPRRHQHDIFSLSSEIEPKIIKTLEEERPMQYEVVKQICLSSSREHPLSLFEVVPLGSVPSYLSQSVVDIRPLRGDLMQRKHGISGNGHDEQLTAALRAAETTPHKVRARVNQRSHQEEPQKRYAIADELRMRKGFFDSLEMPATQRSRAEIRTVEHRTSSTQTTHPGNDEGSIMTAEAERDEAFQKFLKRLLQKNGGFQGRKKQGRVRVDSGSEDGSREEEKKVAVEASVLRYRTQVSDQRKENISELCSNPNERGLDKFHSKGDTNGSADSDGFPRESTKFKNLNPKAREFLSFVSHQSSNSGEGNMAPFRTFAAEPFADKDGQTNMMSLAGHALPNVSSLQPPPPYGLMPLEAAAGTTDPLMLNSLMTGRLVPVSTGQFGGQLPASALSMPPLPSLLPPMIRPQSVLQSMTGNVLGIQTAPHMLNAAFPLTAGSVNPCLSMPSCQMPLVGNTPRPPQPVPKPRRPDPGDQQAYEAWIEWRKANEPGYALECRLRQQRRAQRSMTDNAAPKAPPGQKSEASVST
ncbi:hypothetical protein TARUN_9450 [Trichoderma arundinaceum]|uniref:Uncharacterized protein n=1 Tax=Trichoderma arundinaceum TaxID=490622 RepID=A0A395NA55_TRIAR|nr:hypothetical protein TARUN_9450 [Trichoderma arundinaceum]